MQRKWSELTEAAWIARFWAFYRPLPDSFKAGFTGMARGMALELEAQAEGRLEPRGADRDPPLLADIIVKTRGGV
jgi:hypothetical protein